MGVFDELVRAGRSGSLRVQPRELTESRNELEAMAAIRFPAGPSYTPVARERAKGKQRIRLQAMMLPG